jgi:polyhydroxyalkanoate synthase subunit PhaC
MLAAEPTDNPADSVAERFRLEMERAIQRNIKGLEFLTAGPQSVGAMDRELIYRRGTAMLYRYRAVRDEVYRIPLLIVSPPSNHGYIFDLAKGQSLVEFLLHRGFDVYLLDWAWPTRDEAGLGLSAYVEGFIPDAIAEISRATGEDQISLAGYCMGGTLSVIYAGLNPQSPIRNLVAFATPVDFLEMEAFQKWADRRHFDVDKMVDALGMIPGDVMLGAFDIMRPANRTAGKIHLWTNMWNDEFVRSYRMFDRWAAETLPVPGEYFREQIKLLIWENALLDGTLEMGGRTADLRNIDAAILNIVAQHDHVVSRESAQPLMTRTSSTDREEIVAKGGHVSLVAGTQALHRMWPRIDQWLSVRST